MPDRLKMMAWLGAKFTLKGHSVHHRTNTALRHSRSMPLRHSSETEYESDDSHPYTEALLGLRSVNVHSYDPVPDALHPPDCECILCVDRILDEFPTPPPRPNERPPDMMEELIEVEILPDKVYKERRRRLESEQREVARVAFISYVCDKYNTQVQDKQRGVCQTIFHTKEEWDILVEYHPAFASRREERRRLGAFNRSSQSLDANMWLGSGSQGESKKPKLSNGPVAKQPELVHKTTVASVRPIQIAGLNQPVAEDVVSDRSDDDSPRRLRHQGLRNLAGKTTCPKCFKKASSGKGNLCKLHRHPKMPHSISLPSGNNYSTPPAPRPITYSVLVQDHRMVSTNHERPVSDSTSDTLVESASFEKDPEKVGMVEPNALKQGMAPSFSALQINPQPKISHCESGGSPQSLRSRAKPTVFPRAGKAPPKPIQPTQLQQGGQPPKKALPPPISVPPKAVHFPQVTQVSSSSASFHGYSPSQGSPAPASISSPLRRRPAQSGHNPKHSNGSVASHGKASGRLDGTPSSPPRPVNTRFQKPSPLPVRQAASKPSQAQPSSLRNFAQASSPHKDKPLPRYPAPERVDPRVFEGLRQRVREPSFSGHSDRCLPVGLSSDGTFPRRI